MKKYLSAGAAALMGVAFISCSHDFDDMSLAESVTNTYNEAFIEAFGQPAANQTWGFGEEALSTRANPGTDVYPATHEYKDADGNVIAGANMNHNQWGSTDLQSNPFGGWVVPDPLTEGQKLRVQRYFQTHPYLGYEDPHFRHFFVQQVYKGGSDQQGVSKENIVAADNSTYTSSNMNQLTVGVANSHINDFNAGTCSPSNVLNHEGKTQEDQITLMVNVYDTSCFGYHDSGSSNQSADSPNHNDKMALASAAVIDAWADSLQNATGETIGEAVVDKWNRSFMGFDLAIKEGAQAYATDNAGNVLYATYDQAAESPKVAWDGEKMINIADPTKYYPIEYYDEYKTIMGCGWLTTNQNFYVAESKVTMSQTISMNRAQASTITTIQDAPVLKDVMVGDTYYQSVINLPRIKQLVENGYLPVNNKNLTEWVKVGKSDGYYSDWIVTLTEAKRIDSENDTTTVETWGDPIRIIAEDLTRSQRGDFDFNDVVFDVRINSTKTKAEIRLKAAGGTLPLTVGWSGAEGTNYQDYEVHNLYEESISTMINTHARTGVDDKPDVVYTLTGDFTNGAKDVKVMVCKSGEWIELQAHQGEPASKIAVSPTYEWCDERQDIRQKYSNFSTYVQNPNMVEWWHATPAPAE